MESTKSIYGVEISQVFCGFLLNSSYFYGNYQIGALLNVLLSIVTCINHHNIFIILEYIVLKLFGSSCIDVHLPQLVKNC